MGASIKQWPLEEQFCKDTAYCPDIYCKAIFFFPQHEFWSSVPKSFHFSGEGFL